MIIRNAFVRSGSLLCSIAALLLAAGCESAPTGDDDSDVTGGTGGTGGTTATMGGSSGSGTAGAQPSTGGTTAMGNGGTTAMGNGGSTSTAGAGNPAGGAPPTAGAGGSTGIAGSGNPAGGAPPMGGAGGQSAGAAGAGAGAPPTAGTGGGGTGGPDPWNGYNPDFKEFVGEGCMVKEPADVNNPKLPDLFQQLDGSRMSTKAQWACRRAELKAIVEKYIHGPKPGKPEMVTGSVTNSSIKVHVEQGGKSVDFSVSVSVPAGAKMPAPIIIGLGGGSLDKKILTDEGVALANYSNNSISDEKSRSGLFSQLYPNTAASAQVGWAWGVSRIIDVLVAEAAAGRNTIFDPKAVGVTGCSRLGKGAFTIGAFDERIALGIPQESGTGGVSAFRIVNTAPTGPNGKPAQSLDSAWTEAQGWFGTVFQTYKGKVNVIPGDTHSLVAMYAPRGLLVLDNSRIGELGSKAQHGASAAGMLVYKALGVEHNIEYHGGRPDDPHNHCSFYPEQEQPLRDAIRAFLTKKDVAKGKIEPQPAGTVDLTQWIDWDAPTLQ